MIHITNNISYLKKYQSSHNILNLSKDFFEFDTINISEKIFTYKNRFEKEYLACFEKINQIHSDNLCYLFSPLSWKSYFVKDPLIDIIYYFIFKDYIHLRDLIVYVESEELLLFLYKEYKNSDIKFKISNKYKSLVYSKIRPIFYISKMLKSKLIYTKHLRQQFDYQDSEVLLYSFPLERSFSKGNSWNDSFFGNLYNEIKMTGYKIYRFSPIEPNAFEDELASRNQYFMALIQFFSLKDIIKILFKKCEYSNFSNVKINQIDFSHLFDFYMQTFKYTNEFTIRYSFHFLFEKMINQCKPKIVIYPYENQPWEKSINLICSKHGTKSIAIQHSLLSYNMYYLHNLGLPNNILPSCILANGKYGEDVLTAMNDKTVIYNIGSKRHLYKYDALPTKRGIKIHNVLIAFSGVTYELYDIIKILNNNSSKINEFTFYLKPPPEPFLSNIYREYKKIRNNIKFNAYFVSDKNLDEMFDICDTVIFINTTVGLEAYIKNKITIRYSTSTNYDLNLTEKIKNGIYFAKYNNFIDILKAAVEQNIDNEKIDIEYFFKTWDNEEFKKILLKNLQ